MGRRAYIPDLELGGVALEAHLVHQQLDALVKSHRPGVQPDVDDDSRGTPQPIPQLREADIVSLEKALLEHELLAVESPALAEDRLPDETSKHPWVLVGFERRHVVAGIGFVHRDDGNPRAMMRTEAFLPLLGRERALDRCQDELAEKLFVERPDRTERAEGRRASHGGRRIDGDDALARRERDDVVGGEKGLGGFHLRLVLALDAVDGWMVVLERLVHVHPRGARFHAAGDLGQLCLGIRERLLPLGKNRGGVVGHVPAFLEDELVMLPPDRELAGRDGEQVDLQEALESLQGGDGIVVCPLHLVGCGARTRGEGGDVGLEERPPLGGLVDAALGEALRWLPEILSRLGQERADGAQAGGDAPPFLCRLPWLIDQAGERAVLQIELGILLPRPQGLLLEDGAFELPEHERPVNLLLGRQRQLDRRREPPGAAPSARRSARRWRRETSRRPIRVACRRTVESGARSGHQTAAPCACTSHAAATTTPNTRAG